MIKDNKFIPLAIVLLLGILVQVWFGTIETNEVPSVAAVEFTKALFTADKSKMADRLCAEKAVIDGLDVVDMYIHERKKAASDRGFGLFYLKEKLYQINAETISNDGTNARVKLTCKRKPPLKSFFTKESYKKFAHTFDLKMESGKWKVCESKFSSLT